MKKTVTIVLSSVLLLCIVSSIGILLATMNRPQSAPETAGASADVLEEFTPGTGTEHNTSEITNEVTTDQVTDPDGSVILEEITNETVTEPIVTSPSYVYTNPYQKFYDVVDTNKYDIWYKNENENTTTQLEINMRQDRYHKFWEEELAFTLKIAKPLFVDSSEYESWKSGIESWLETSREICRVERMKFSSSLQSLDIFCRFTDAVRQKVIDTKYFLYLLETEIPTNYKDPYIGITWNEDEIIQSVISETDGNKTSGSQGLNYQIYVKNGQPYAVLTGIGTCTDTDIVVADYYNGYPVTQIGEKAFYKQEQITSVTLPDTMKIIGSYAFYECKSLATIKNSTNLYGIQAYAFNNCTSLTEIYLPDKLGYIESFAFCGCNSLTKINIPDQLRTIYEDTFSYCTSLEIINLPDCLETIYYDAFSGCTNLKEIDLPSSVQSIYFRAFAGCSNLETFRYEGTVAEWSKVEKQGAWKTGAPFMNVICSDGTGHIANTELDPSDFADLPEVYRAVLNNEKTFIYSVGESTVMLLDDYAFPYLKESILNCHVKYATVDMDGDGEVEVLLEGSCGDVLVLHHENGIVFGYDFVFRYMSDVKTDGTFSWSYTGNKHSYGVHKLTFSAESYVLIDVCYVEEEGEDKVTYFIGEHVVSKTEYDAFYSTLSQEKVTWTSIGRYPVKQGHTSM